MKWHCGYVYYCEEHRAAFDARAEHEAWSYTWEIPTPLVEAIRLIDSNELMQVMEKALADVEEAVNRTLDKLKRAVSAL